jgi:hypothetical protein
MAAIKSIENYAIEELHESLTEEKSSCIFTNNEFK